MEAHHHFSKRNIIWAVLLGLAVTLFLVFRNFRIEDYTSIVWHKGMLWILVGVLLLLAFRILGYVIRLRILTDKSLTWKACFQVVLLWEFTSALTPTVIGGTAAALFIMAREKLNIARSTSIVMLTAVFDELYYLLVVPLVALIVGFNNLFPAHAGDQAIAGNLKAVFFFGYGMLLVYTLALIIGLLWKPIIIKKLLFWLTKLPIIKRYQRGAVKLGNDLQITAVEFRNKPSSFWTQTFLATALTWTARFFMVNMLVLSFTNLNLQEHFVVFGRQLSMWIILILTPLPGAAGSAEVSFSYYIGEFLPQGTAASMALIWRLFSYYMLIVLGSFALPRWIKRTAKEHELKPVQK